MDGLALHYYTSVKRLPDGSRVGSATQFDEAEWIEIVSKGLFMDELVRRHSTIMDKYDPAKKVAMIVDEWGTWYAVEPGTHPRFLYQQNTMRDAIVAATTLDIFNKHCDRVRMANIAQTVNVLQAMILTQGEKMLLTPSYHVFEMYAAHQGAAMAPVDVQSERYEHAGYSVPAVSASASVDAGRQAAHHPEQRQPEPGHPGEGVCAGDEGKPGALRANGACRCSGPAAMNAGETITCREMSRDATYRPGHRAFRAAHGSRRVSRELATDQCSGTARVCRCSSAPITGRERGKR